ncbi:JAB domain-containing protein [Thiocapsa sp. N5-Cardenillas]|uniref:JAB domain-containing protein n=1 Tax=Thiocapsa sp. N5-Cardenillas TaxID=3137397 RepID=UPI0035AE3DAF
MPPEPFAQEDLPSFDLPAEQAAPQEEAEPQWQGELPSFDLPVEEEQPAPAPVTSPVTPVTSPVTPPAEELPSLDNPDPQDRGWWEQRGADLQRGWQQLKSHAAMLGSIINVKAQEAELQRMMEWLDPNSNSRKLFDANLKAEAEVMARSGRSPAEIAAYQESQTAMRAEELLRRIDKAEAKIKEGVERVAKAQEAFRGIAPSDPMQQIAEGDGSLSSVLSVWADHPLGLPAALSLESLPPSAPGVLATIPLGLTLGKAGTAIGAFGTASFPEVMGKITEAMDEAGVELTNPEQIEAFLADPVARADVIKRGLQKGLTIGAINAAMGGIAGKALTPAIMSGSVRKVAQAAALEAGGQMAGEAMGELAGQVMAGEEVSLGDAALEVLGSGPDTAVETAINVYTGIRDQRAARAEERANTEYEATRAAAARRTAERRARQAMADQLRAEVAAFRARQGGRDATATASAAAETGLLIGPDGAAEASNAIHDATKQSMELVTAADAAAFQAEQEQQVFQGAAQQLALQEAEQRQLLLQAREEDEQLQQAQRDAREVVVATETARIVEQEMPQAGIALRHPEIAEAAVIEGYSKQPLIEIRTAEGAIVAAVFDGYDPNTRRPHIGLYVPDAKNFTHTPLPEGYEVLTNIPSWEQWEAMTRGPTDAVQKQGATPVSGGEGTAGIRPVEGQVRSPEATPGEEVSEEEAEALRQLEARRASLTPGQVVVEAQQEAENDEDAAAYAQLEALRKDRGDEAFRRILAAVAYPSKGEDPAVKFGVATFMDALNRVGRDVQTRMEEIPARPLPPDTLFTVWDLGEGIPRVIQVDLFMRLQDGRKVNIRSGNPFHLAKEGYIVPEIPAAVPGGQYTEQQLAEKIAALPTAAPTEQAAPTPAPAPEQQPTTPAAPVAERPQPPAPPVAPQPPAAPVEAAEPITELDPTGMLDDAIERGNVTPEGLIILSGSAVPPTAGNVGANVADRQKIIDEADKRLAMIDRAAQRTPQPTPAEVQAVMPPNQPATTWDEARQYYRNMKEAAQVYIQDQQLARQLWAEREKRRRAERIQRREARRAERAEAEPSFALMMPDLTPEQQQAIAAIETQARRDHAATKAQRGMVEFVMARAIEVARQKGTDLIPSIQGIADAMGEQIRFYVREQGMGTRAAREKFFDRMENDAPYRQKWIEDSIDRHFVNIQRQAERQQRLADEEAARERRRQEREAAGLPPVTRTRPSPLTKVGTDAAGNEDILTNIADFGGIPAPRQPLPGEYLPQEYDGFFDNFTGVAQFLINYEPGNRPWGAGGVDTWFQEFADQYPIFRDLTLSEFFGKVYDAVLRRDVTARQVAARQQQEAAEQARIDTQAKVERSLLRNEKKPRRFRRKTPVIVEDLDVGDVFTVDGEQFTVIARDEATGVVTIQDGISYELAKEQKVFPDRYSLKKAPREVRFLDEQEFAASNLPTLRRRKRPKAWERPRTEAQTRALEESNRRRREDAEVRRDVESPLPILTAEPEERAVMQAEAQAEAAERGEIGEEPMVVGQEPILAEEIPAEETLEGQVEEPRGPYGLQRPPRSILQLIDATLAAEDWRMWYEENYEVLQEIFGPDTDLFADLLAITSLNQTVESNVTYALAAFEQWMRGEKFRVGTRQMSRKLEHYRKTGEIVGPKIEPYSRAMKGDVDAKAIDRHVIRIFFATKEKPNPAVTPQRRARANEMIDQIASILRWTPRQVQAALWAAWQISTGKTPQSYAESIRGWAKELGIEPGQARRAFLPSPAGTGLGLPAGAQVARRGRAASRQVREDVARYGRSEPFPQGAAVRFTLPSGLTLDGIITREARALDGLATVKVRDGRGIRREFTIRDGNLALSPAEFVPPAPPAIPASELTEDEVYEAFLDPDFNGYEMLDLWRRYMDLQPEPTMGMDPFDRRAEASAAALMQAIGPTDDVVGVEFRQRDRPEVVYLLTPSMSRPGQWRVTRIDEYGPSGHFTVPTFEDGVMTLGGERTESRGVPEKTAFEVEVSQVARRGELGTLREPQAPYGAERDEDVLNRLLARPYRQPLREPNTTAERKVGDTEEFGTIRTVYAGDGRWEVWQRPGDQPGAAPTLRQIATKDELAELGIIPALTPEEQRQIQADEARAMRALDRRLSGAVPADAGQLTIPGFEEEQAPYGGRTVDEQVQAKADEIGKALFGAIDFIQASINYRQARTAQMGVKHYGHPPGTEAFITKFSSPRFPQTWNPQWAPPKKGDLGVWRVAKIPTTILREDDPTQDLVWKHNTLIPTADRRVALAVAAALPADVIDPDSLSWADLLEGKIPSVEFPTAALFEKALDEYRRILTETEAQQGAPGMVQEGPLQSPMREGGVQTALILDGVAYVGGRNHGETYNAMLDRGISEADMGRARAGFTRPDGHTVNLQGATVQVQSIVRLGQETPGMVQETGEEFSLTGESEAETLARRQDEERTALRRMMQAELARRAEAPLAPRRAQVAVEQGELFAGQETLFSGESQQARNLAEIEALQDEVEALDNEYGEGDRDELANLLDTAPEDLTDGDIAALRQEREELKAIAEGREPPATGQMELFEDAKAYADKLEIQDPQRRLEAADYVAQAKHLSEGEGTTSYQPPGEPEKLSYEQLEQIERIRTRLFRDVRAQPLRVIIDGLMIRTRRAATEAGKDPVAAVRRLDELIRSGTAAFPNMSERLALATYLRQLSDFTERQRIADQIVASLPEAGAVEEAGLMEAEVTDEEEEAQRELEERREFFRDPTVVGPRILQQLGEGRTVRAILAEHVSGELATWNIDGLFIDTVQDLAATQLALRSPSQESLKFAFTDANGRVIHSGVASMGSIQSAMATPDIFLREWAVAQAKGADMPRFWMLHNHPSGIVQPSSADLSVANGFTAAVEQAGGQLMDFIVTDGETFWSMVHRMEMSYGVPRTLAPFEILPAEMRKHINQSQPLNDMAEALRQGNPDAEFVVFVDTANGVTGVTQIILSENERASKMLDPETRYHRVISKWKRTILSQIGAVGGRNVFLITNGSMAFVNTLREKLALADVMVIDGITPATTSMRENGYMTPLPFESAKARSNYVAEDVSPYGSDPETSLTPATTPPKPPRRLLTQGQEQQTAAATNNAPPSNAHPEDTRPPVETPGRDPLSLDPSDMEAADAEGLANLQDANEEEREDVPTRVFGEKFTVLGRRGGPAERARAIRRAARVFDEAGIAVVFDEANEVFRLKDQITPVPELGDKLLEILRREFATRGDFGSPLLSTLVNSIRNPDGGLWKAPAFTHSQRMEMFSLAQSEASFYGLMLGALAKQRRSLNFVAEHIDVVLHKLFSDRFNGPLLSEVMDAIRKEMGDEWVRQVVGRFTNEQLRPLGKIDTPIERETDLDLFIGQLLDMTTRGIRISPIPDDIAKQIAAFFPLAGWRTKITREGGQKLAQQVIDLLAGQEKQLLDPEGEQQSIEGNVKRMDRLLQKELQGIIKDVLGQIERGLQNPNFLADLATALGDEQSRTERLAYMDQQVRAAIETAREGELSAAEENDVDAVNERFDGILERWDERFQAISEQTASTGTLRKITNYLLKDIFPAFRTNWQNIVDGRTPISDVRADLLKRVAAELASINSAAPEAALTPERTQQIVDAFGRTFDAMAAKKRQDIEARRAAARARRLDPQVAAEDYIRRLERKFADVRGMPEQERNRVFDAIREQRANPASPDVFAATLGALGVQVETARTLAGMVQRDIEAGKRRRALNRLRGLAGPSQAASPKADKIPGLRELASRILAADPQTQKDPAWRERIIKQWLRENGLSEPEIATAWDTLKDEMDQIIRNTGQRATNEILNRFRQRVQRMVNSEGKRKQLYQRIQELVNQGIFDTEELLTLFAAYQGMRYPTKAERQRLKDLATLEQRLSRLTEDERRSIGENPERIAQAEAEKAAVTLNRRVELQNEMQLIFSRLSRPLQMRTAEGRRNMGEAMREFVSANMLFKLGFGFRQIIDVATQGLVHLPYRSIAAIQERRRVFASDPDRPAFMVDLTQELLGDMRTVIQTAGMAVNQFGQTMKGRGIKRNIEGFNTSMMMFERMRARRQEDAQRAANLLVSGDPKQVAKGVALSLQNFALTLIGTAELALRFTRAMDQIQGVPIEAQERRQRLISALQDYGYGVAQSRTMADDILGDWWAEQALAMTHARSIAEATGDDALMQMSSGQLRAAAYELFRTRQLSRMKAANMPAERIDQHAQIQRQTRGWNMQETTGIGGAIGAGVRGFGRAIEHGFGFALPIGQFSNAIATGINIGLTWAGLGLFPGAFGGVDPLGRGKSPWYRTEKDRFQRKMEAVTGLASVPLWIWLFAGGMLRVWIEPPDDPEDRELWEKDGHRAGTAELVLGDKYVALSLTTGPLAMFRIPLTAIGYLQATLARRAKRQATLERLAKERGLEPPEQQPITLDDMSASLAVGAFSAITGGRTAGGAVRSLRAGTDTDAITVRTTTVAQLSPLIVGLPAYQEIQRSLGVRMAADKSGMLDMFFPTSGSEARKVNFLGDELTPGFPYTTMLNLTGGTGWPIKEGQFRDEVAYDIFSKIAYRPSPIRRTEGFIIGDTFRPLTPEEHQRATRLRQSLLKAGMNQLDPNEDERTLTRQAMDVAARSKEEAIARTLGGEAAMQFDWSGDEEVIQDARQSARDVFGDWERSGDPSERAYLDGAILEGRVPMEGSLPSREFLREWQRLRASTRRERVMETPDDERE